MRSSRLQGGVAAGSPEGGLLCDELIEPGQMDEAIDRSVDAFCESGTDARLVRPAS